MQVCAVNPHGPQEWPSGTKGTSEPWRLASAIVHIKGFAKVAGDPKKRRKRQAGAFWMELLKNKRTNKSIIISLQRRSAFSFTTEGPAPSCSFTYFFLFVQGGGKGSQPLQTAPWGWGSRVQGLGSHSPPPLSLALSPAGPASHAGSAAGELGPGASLSAAALVLTRGRGAPSATCTHSTQTAAAMMVRHALRPPPPPLGTPSPSGVLPTPTLGIQGQRPAAGPLGSEPSRRQRPHVPVLLSTPPFSPPFPSPDSSGFRESRKHNL